MSTETFRWLDDNDNDVNFNLYNDDDEGIYTFDVEGVGTGEPEATIEGNGKENLWDYRACPSWSSPPKIN